MEIPGYMNQGKRACLLAIVPLAAVFGMMPSQIHGAGAAVTTAQVHLRSAPSTSAQILATLARGTSVEQGRCEAGWCSVTFGARAGYVAKRYLYVAQRPTVVAPQGKGYTNSRGLYVPSPQYSLKALIQQMEQHNREREALLKSYAVDRVYKVESKRLNMPAEVQVTMIFLAPGEKLFEVRSQSGSGFMRRGVINRIIDTEQKNGVPAQKPKTAITSENYQFDLVGQEVVKGRLQYILHAKARRKELVLFDAKIWVDAEDFAVTRIEGRPAKNPSFWTRKVEFTHEYEKFGPFWLPVANHSTTHVILFGKITIDLGYSNYRINQPGLEERAAEIRKRGDKLEIQIDPKDKQLLFDFSANETVDDYSPLTLAGTPMAMTPDGISFTNTAPAPMLE
jgi:uncharacterized protein YraI